MKRNRKPELEPEPNFSESITALTASVEAMADAAPACLDPDGAEVNLRPLLDLAKEYATGGDGDKMIASMLYWIASAALVGGMLKVAEMGLWVMPFMEKLNLEHVLSIVGQTMGAAEQEAAALAASKLEDKSKLN